MKIMVISFKRSHTCTATLSAPNPVAGHCQPTPPSETLGHSQASLDQSLVGPLLLSPRSWCAQCSVCALQESVSPVLCKFWQLYGGVMATASKRVYAIPRSAIMVNKRVCNAVLGCNLKNDRMISVHFQGK